MEYEVSAELGMNIMRLYGNGLISPIAKFGGGISRFVDSSWSIGFKLNWWFVPEIHLGAFSNLTSYANFLEFSIGANYISEGCHMLIRRETENSSLLLIEKLERIPERISQSSPKEAISFSCNSDHSDLVEL